MRYLIPADFKKLIQSDNLSQIIGGDTTLLNSAVDAAISELTSYLIQKYDCSREFADMSPWDIAVAYKANQRAYLDATAYNPTATYLLNTLTLQAGNVYICTSAITVPETFTIGHWTLLGAQYAVFYASLPYPEFNYNSLYVQGNQVWWKDSTYTAQQATPVPSHQATIQYSSYNDIPSYNVAPDTSTQFWGAGVAYSVAAGTLPTNTTKWTSGDNRNPQLVNYCVDVALYTLHSRIAPRNIPELRVKRYDDTISWLKGAAQGKYFTAALPLIQPTQGMRIRTGGNVKNNNTL